MTWHRWIGDDSDVVSCLTCGGAWSEPAGQIIQSFDGNPPPPCTGNTRQCHHYAGECQNEAYGEECQIDPECNCLFCHS